MLLKSQVQLASNMLKKHGADMPRVERCAPERNYSKSHLRRLKSNEEMNVNCLWLGLRGKGTRLLKLKHRIEQQVGTIV